MNTFGEVGTDNQYPLYDSRAVADVRTRFGRPTVPYLDRANSLYIPAGRWPTRGWVVVRRGDYDEVDQYSTALQLEIGDPSREDNVGTLYNLAVVRAQCVTRGVAADDDALYLVELTDARGVLHNRWFSAPLTARYNVRAPAYPSTFYADSLNGGTTWTWETMLADMWGAMSGHLGAWPGLPAGFAPAGTPEGYWFPGVPAWPALCDVLDHLGLLVAVDHTSGTPYTIVQSGADDEVFTAAQATYGGAGSAKYRLEDDLEWIDVGAGRVPGTVVVFFRRRNEVYGTEETVYWGDDDLAKQWLGSPYYSVSVSAPSTFSSATGTHHLWSDFTVRYDDSGNPLDEDVTQASVIAAERASQYFEDINPADAVYRVYTGALPFKTGSLCDGVCYYQDGTSGRGGWRTKVVRGISPPFDVCEE